MQSSVVPYYLINRILEYLTNRTQYVKPIFFVTSSIIVPNTDAPQGTILVSFSITLHTADVHSDLPLC